MCHAVDIHPGVHHFENGLEETLVHRQQRICTRRLRPGKQVFGLQPLLVENHLPRQREPVRLESTRRQPDQHVTNRDPLARDDAFPLHLPDDRPHEVILTHGVETGHLGSLTAQKSAPILGARLAQPFNHIVEYGGIEDRSPDVVQEEEGRRALHEDIVHTVVNDVLPHGVMTPRHRCDFELRPHAVRRRHKQRVRSGALEQPAEAPDTTHHAGRYGLLHHLLDGFNATHLLVNVHAGCGVCARLVIHSGLHLS